MMDTETSLRELLESWAEHTRLDRRDEILANHASTAVIFDVMPPLKYEGVEAYRRSWDEWQPATEGEFRFEFRELSIVSGDQVAFAFGIIECGGTRSDGTPLSDFVRATFCLRKEHDRWEIVHQHISMPMPGSSQS